MSRSAPVGLFVAIGFIAIGGVARAADDTPAPVATNDATADQIAAWIGRDAPAVHPLGTGSDVELTPLPDRRIHGEVGANVGNRGYGGYGAVSMPLGRASELDVGVAGQHYDYGRWGKGDAKAVSVALLVDGNDLKNLISRRKCNVPRWGVKLPDDPVVLPDGSCLRGDAEKDKAEAARRRADVGQVEAGRPLADRF